eukprot:4989711-Amphidinium_carterae.1
MAAQELDHIQALSEVIAEQVCEEVFVKDHGLTVAKVQQEVQKHFYDTLHLRGNDLLPDLISGWKKKYGKLIVAVPGGSIWFQLVCDYVTCHAEAIKAAEEHRLLVELNSEEDHDGTDASIPVVGRVSNENGPKGINCLFWSHGEQQDLHLDAQTWERAIKCAWSIVVDLTDRKGNLLCLREDYVSRPKKEHPSESRSMSTVPNDNGEMYWEDCLKVVREMWSSMTKDEDLINLLEHVETAIRVPDFLAVSRRAEVNMMIVNPATR